jgi:hypothetical protein
MLKISLVAVIYIIFEYLLQFFTTITYKFKNKQLNLQHN